MTSAYYSDALVSLFLGSYSDHLEEMVGADAIVTDPPYGETSLVWDRWPNGWPAELVHVSNSLWCFGSFRMFMDQHDDFDEWKFSHEIVWEKQNGSGFVTDKFRRVHEFATLWYKGAWRDVRHEVPRVPREHDLDKSGRRRNNRGEHMGALALPGAYADDGLRLTKSVIRVNNEQSWAVHPTQKPLGIVTPLIEYSVPVGGLVVDPFAGSGTTLLAAKLIGRRAIGTEINEAYCESAARRLSQQAFDLGDIA